MPKKISKEEFKIMPWKNGGGTTSEIYVIKELDKILFRLSMATIKSDGPFSLFPNIDRTLLLLSGNGVNLQIDGNTPFAFNQRNSPIYFKGEQIINSTLIDGECLDFNVMVDRDFGRASLVIRDIQANETIHVIDGQMFIFNQHTFDLYVIEKNDKIVFENLMKEMFLIKLE